MLPLSTHVVYADFSLLLPYSCCRRYATPLLSCQDYYDASLLSLFFMLPLITRFISLITLITRYFRHCYAYFFRLSAIRHCIMPPFRFHHIAFFAIRYYFAAADAIATITTPLSPLRHTDATTIRYYGFRLVADTPLRGRHYVFAILMPPRQPSAIRHFFEFRRHAADYC